MPQYQKDQAKKEQYPKAKQHSAGSATTAPKGVQLLFINKDANNLSRTPAEIYAVGSHVSRGSRKWKRTQSSLELDHSTGRILAAAGLDSSGVSQSPGPSTGKPMTLRWRMDNGKVTSTETIEHGDITRRRPKGIKSATTSPRSTQLSTPTMPPTPTLADGHGRSVRTLLGFYFDVIRPFALSISRGWLWVDDPSFVLASPALTYSICAFASAFRTSAEQGLHSLALPPETIDEDEPLWPVPDWFIFQAQAISLLHRHLVSTTDSLRPVQKPGLHTMLFLMRLQIFLGDKEAALLHLNAIRNATQDAAILPDLHLDMAMWKINFMVAFVNQSGVVLQPYIRVEDPAMQQPLLDIDRLKMKSAAEWRRLRAHALNRTILWRTDSPETVDPQTEPVGLVEDFLAIDSEVNRLSDEMQHELKSCLQMSRYLFAYLRYINADTTQEQIRDLCLSLKKRLSNLLQADRPSLLWRRIPRLIFYIAFTGAFASRGHEDEREWFAQKICHGISCGSSSSFDDMKNIIGMFLDPGSVNEGLLKEVWDDVLACQ